MSTLANLKVRTKVLCALGLVLFVVLGVSLIAIDRLSAINDRAADIRDNWLPSTGTQGQLQSALQAFRVFEARSISAADDNERQQMTAEVSKRLQAVERLRAAYEPLITLGTDDIKFMQAFDAAWTDHKRIESKYLNDSKANPRDLFTEQNRKNFMDAAAALQNDLDFNIAEGKKAADEGAAIYVTTKLLMLGVMAIAVILSGLLAYVVISTISVPIVLLTKAMNRLAQSDWSTEVPGTDRTDELGEMANAINVLKMNGVKADSLSAEKAAAQAVKGATGGAARYADAGLSKRSQENWSARSPRRRPSCRRPPSP